MHTDEHKTTDIRNRLSLPIRELQQTVAGILTQAAAALAEPGLAPTSKRYLEQIVRQANWLADMIEDFLRPARRDVVPRARTPADDAAASDADVTEVVDGAVAVARLTWPGQITVASPGEPARCRLHPVLLRKVILNVLGNALRAAGSSGSVTIRVKRHQHATVLSIRDSGPGFGNIPTGFGIGLAEVARIVADNGGRMDLENFAEAGVGVILWLPRLNGVAPLKRICILAVHVMSNPTPGAATMAAIQPGPRGLVTRGSRRNWL